MGFLDGILDFGKDAVGAINDVLGSPFGDMATSAGSAYMSMEGIKAMNEANAAEGKKNRMFQQRMARLAHQRSMFASNTQYQRGMKDMQKAGLNPMLAFSQGGASSPTAPSAGGAQAVMQDEVTPAINTGFTAKRLSAEIQNIHAQTAQTEAQTQVAKTQEAINAAMIPKIEAETNQTVQSATQIAEQTKVVRETVNKVLAETANIKVDSKRMTKAIDLMNNQISSMKLDRVTATQAMQQVQNAITLGKNEIPRSEAEAAAWSSDYGKSIRAYLPDFLSISNGARSAAAASGSVRSRRK